MSYANSRIKDLNMPLFDMIAALSDGNVGAVSVMCMLVKDGGAIDPDSVLGGIGQLLDLDTNDIYGPGIWMFYKDVCKGNLNTMVGLMRAVQLGCLRASDLNHAIDNHGDGLDISWLLAKVKERLPAFVLSEEKAA